MTFHTDIQVRFADTDALGHVNNGSFVVYAETARLEFAKALLGSGFRALILAHVAVDFRRQVVFGQSVSVDTWVESIGRTSVTIRQIVRANGETAAEIKSVVVSFDYTAQRSTPWTSEAMAAFAEYATYSSA